MAGEEKLNFLERMGFGFQGQDWRQVELARQSAAQDIEVQAENLRNAQLQRKLTMADLASENDMAAGFGMTRGGLRARFGAAGVMRTMAEANLANQQARSMAVATKLSTQTMDEILDDLLGKQSFATGIPVEDLKTAMQANKALDHAQTAQFAQLQDSFMMGFDQIEQAYRQQAGDPKLDLFGLKDANDAAKEMQQLLAGNPTLTPEAAFRQVYGKAAGLARNKFLEVSGMGNDLRGGGAGLPAAQAGPEGGLFQKGLLEMLRKGTTSAEAQAQPAYGVPRTPRNPGTIAGWFESLPLAPPGPQPYDPLGLGGK